MCIKGVGQYRPYTKAPTMTMTVTTPATFDETPHSGFLYILSACNAAQAALTAQASCKTLHAAMAHNDEVQDELAAVFAVLQEFLPQGFNTPAP